MKNVLVVDDEETLLMIMVGRFEDYRDRFNVFTARNGRLAVGVLEKEAIDLVVTDLKMPEMDGVELLAYMANKFPSIPAIAVSAYCTPEIQKKLEGLGTLRVMDKPVDFDLLAQEVLKALESSHQGGSLTGFSISSFLQIIEMEEKTCTVEVHAPNEKRGNMYIVRGELYDAACGDLRGEEAAYAIISWEDVQLFLKELPKKRPAQRIEKSIMSVVMEGLRRKDEAEMLAGEEGEKVPTGRSGMEEPVVQIDSESAISDEDDLEPPGDLDFENDDTFMQELDGMLEMLDVAEAAAGEQKTGPQALEVPSNPTAPASPAAGAPESAAGVLRLTQSRLRGRKFLQAVAVEAGRLFPVELALQLAVAKNKPGYLRVEEQLLGGTKMLAKGKVLDCKHPALGQMIGKKSPAVFKPGGQPSGSLEKAAFEEAGMQAGVFMPLISNGSVSGVLFLASKNAERLVQKTTEIDWVAAAVALAGERNRLEETLKRQALTLETVDQIGRALVVPGITMEKLLRFSMDKIRQILNVEAGSLYVKDKELLKVTIAFNTKLESVKKIRLKLGQGVAGHVAAKGKPMTLNNAETSARYFSGIDQQTGFKTRNVLCLPLVAQRKIIGALEVCNKINGNFSGVDEVLLQTIAATLSVALMNMSFQKRADVRAA